MLVAEVSIPCIFLQGSFSFAHQWSPTEPGRKGALRYRGWGANEWGCAQGGGTGEVQTKDRCAFGQTSIRKSPAATEHFPKRLWRLPSPKYRDLPLKDHQTSLMTKLSTCCLRGGVGYSLRWPGLLGLKLNSWSLIPVFSSVNKCSSWKTWYKYIRKVCP